MREECSVISRLYICACIPDWAVSHIASLQLILVVKQWCQWVGYQNGWTLLMFYCLRLLRMSLNVSGCSLNWWLSAKRWKAAKQLAIVLALLCVDYYVDLDDVLYSLDQMPHLYLFHHAILCGFYLRAATIQEWCLLNLGREMKISTTQGRWSGCRHQEVNPKRCCHACHCNGYRAWGIRKTTKMSWSRTNLNLF